jgi:hypothetical protein
MNRSASFVAFAVTTALALAGCVSTGDAGGTPSGPPPAAAGSPSVPACTSNACITSVIQKSLLGIVAKDDAVVTAATCQPSTLKRNAGGTYTVTCKVTESDGNVSSGYANAVPSTGTITWDPQQVISSG